MGEEVEIGLNDITINSELVITDLDAATNQEALDILANRLLEKGFVKESYIQAVKDREKVFSTGLAFEDMGIAIPHTDSIHVNKQAIAIGILKKPVTFTEMGTEDDKVEAELMFMLAIKKPDAQLNFLSKMMDMFQEKDRLMSIKNASSAEEAARLFKKYLSE